MCRDAENNAVIGYGYDARLGYVERTMASQIGTPICPVGHLVITSNHKTISFLKWIIFEQYETFCSHCDRRYRVVRYKINVHHRDTKKRIIWRYKVWPGPDESITVQSLPEEVLEELNSR